MKVLKLTHIENKDGSGASCTYDAINCPALHGEINELQYCEVGEEWKITVADIPKDEFENLPEFTGW